jgi:hypothetical protein
MSVPTGYFIRVWKKGVDDQRPLYAGWILAYAASQAMRIAVDTWTRHPVDFALITIDRADTDKSASQLPRPRRGAQQARSPEVKKRPALAGQ